MDYSDLELFGLEGGVVYLPFFDLLSRPHEFASLFQASLSEHDREYRISLERVGESDDQEATVRLLLTRKSKPKDEWVFRITHNGITFGIKKVLAGSLTDELNLIFTLLEEWIRVASLEESTLDWAGVQIATLFEYSGDMAASGLPARTLRDDGLGALVASAMSDNAQMTKFDLHSEWKYPAHSESPEQVRELKLFSNKQQIAFSFDCRDTIDSMLNVRELYANVSVFLRDTIFPDILKPLLLLDGFKGN